MYRCSRITMDLFQTKLNNGFWKLAISKVFLVSLEREVFNLSERKLNVPDEFVSLNFLFKNAQFKILGLRRSRNSHFRKVFKLIDFRVIRKSRSFCVVDCGVNLEENFCGMRKSEYNISDVKFQSDFFEI